MASLIICLATNQKFNLSKYIFDAMVKHLNGGVKFLMYPHFPHEAEHEESVPTPSNDPQPSEENHTGVLDDVEMPVEAMVDGKDEQSTKTDDST
ncbi:hypothetical protein Tco_0081463, partial [Tanacetum coccineum]